VPVIGADKFRPFAQRGDRALVDDGCRPRRREDAVILDRELELKPLSFVVGVGRKARIGLREAEIALFAALFRFLRGVMIKQPSEDCGDQDQDEEWHHAPPPTSPLQTGTNAP
jgi:hypothetical protein